MLHSDYEYELIAITFEQPYELPEDIAGFVAEEEHESGIQYYRS